MNLRFKIWRGMLLNVPCDKVKGCFHIIRVVELVKEYWDRNPEAPKVYAFDVRARILFRSEDCRDTDFWEYDKRGEGKRYITHEENKLCRRRNCEYCNGEVFVYADGFEVVSKFDLERELLLSRL